jgi:hypothetical protein
VEDRIAQLSQMGSEEGGLAQSSHGSRIGVPAVVFAAMLLVFLRF